MINVSQINIKPLNDALLTNIEQVDVAVSIWKY